MTSCLSKQKEIKELFEMCTTQEEIYQKIIYLGTTLESYPPSQKLEKNLVRGCQSRMYLHLELTEDRLHFYADSDALISKGLAALLIKIYNGETPDALFRHPPTFLGELNIFSLLSSTRVNGFKSLYLSMQKLSSIHI